MLRSTLLLLTFALPGAALAQQADRTEERVEYKTITEIDFKEVPVDASAQRPSIAYLGERSFSVHPSMIKLRTDFNEEMIESLAELR